MKKIIYGIIGILLILTLMYAEYIYIIYNQIPYIINDNTVVIELFGREDYYHTEIEEYYAKH